MSRATSSPFPKESLENQTAWLQKDAYPEGRVGTRVHDWPLFGNKENVVERLPAHRELTVKQRAGRITTVKQKSVRLKAPKTNQKGCNFGNVLMAGKHLQTSVTYENHLQTRITHEHHTSITGTVIRRRSDPVGPTGPLTDLRSPLSERPSSTTGSSCAARADAARWRTHLHQQAAASTRLRFSRLHPLR